MKEINVDRDHARGNDLFVFDANGLGRLRKAFPDACVNNQSNRHSSLSHHHHNIFTPLRSTRTTSSDIAPWSAPVRAPRVSPT